MEKTKQVWEAFFEKEFNTVHDDLLMVNGDGSMQAKKKGDL